jgi:hypothetical protein
VPITLNATDRIVVKIYGYTASGTDNISISFDDNTNSGLQLPALPASASQFVPYNNPTANLAMGAYAITANGVYSTNVVSATGNITGNYIFGNGSQLTGINLSTSTIFNGLSNINISSSNSNISMAVAGAANTVVVSTGEITVDGVYSNPKTIAGNVIITENINSMMIGPIALGPLGNIYVPDSSTLKIL